MFGAGDAIKTFYRRYEIVANTASSGTVNFDVYDNRKQHLLAGFSQSGETEQTIADRMKERVDQFINEAPVQKSY